MPFSLTTSRLILRDFTPDDRDTFIAQCQHPHYQRFYHPSDLTQDALTTRVAEFINEATMTPRSRYHLAIVEKASQRLIGVAGMRLEDNANAAIGFGLNVNEHGKEYAFEAMTTLLEFGIASYGIKRIYADTLVENRPAVMLCQRLGLIEFELSDQPDILRGTNVQPVRLFGSVL
ncbi:GNAT family N-acetyltransferase [Vibrio proteolyticus]|uniref:Putative acetyltransferase n=1 Tax=Vibrio proteolyticus NBRC 13287 TaxID=1219065 RepID=U3BC67_VIBPR|nr:GNAT family N-acetyltransferase [Vibrio proteolyticus]GAD67354.1 putative acetyltransferase [Vibrio proteolyticus NBRC 13287]